MSVLTGKVNGNHDEVVRVTGRVLAAAAPPRRVLEEEAWCILGRRGQGLGTVLLDLSQGLLQWQRVGADDHLE